MVVRVVIPTYKRSSFCKQAARRVVEEVPDADLHIYLDGATHYDWTIGTMHSLAKRPGREHFHQVWNKILADAYAAEWDYFLALPDDFTPVGNAITKAIDLYNSTDCDVLVPVVDLRGRGPCWVPVDPQDEGDTWYTGWVDGCFLCKRDALDAIGWRVPDFRPEHFQTNQSSGVGKYMSLALHEAGMKVAQVTRTLYLHGDHDSVMHYAERKRNPL